MSVAADIRDKLTAAFAPAQRPGGAMAGQRFFAEPLDVAIVHILEEIPGLIVGAGMGGAKPEIFRQILGRF